MRRPVLLIVDDDELLLELLNDILQDEFTVITASDGPSSLEKLRTASVIDGLITDIDLPGMSGPQLMWEIRRRYPNLPMMGISGTYLSPHKLAEKCPEGTVLLQKPFAVMELLSLARRLFRTENEEWKILKGY